MVGATLAGLWARKLRLALTVLAILLGVALASGTYVFTDTLDKSFEDVFEQGSEGIDVVVVPRGETTGPFQRVAPFDASIVDRIREVPGVDRAAGIVFHPGTVLGKDGQRVGLRDTPHFIASVAPPRLNPFSFRVGRPPRTAGEAGLDAFTASSAGFTIGDRVRVAGAREAKTYRITGIATFGDVSSIGGAAVAFLTPAEAQRMTATESHYDMAHVAAVPGVSPPELKRRLRQALPLSVEVRTGMEDARAQANSAAESVEFLTTAGLAFSAAALLVGAFLIFNTFSITVAQRAREFALLRTLGATRAQVFGAVVLEAVVVGTVASGLGFLLGIGLSKLIYALLESVGAGLPDTSTVISARAAAVSVTVGVLITVAAAMLPARRATRVPPVTALREEAMPARSGGGRVTLASGLVLAAAGVGVIGYGLAGAEGPAETVLTVLGVGAGTVLVSVAILSPRLVPGLARLAGVPVEWASGVVGQLARENSTRNRGRTAATAAALMIGLALVSFVTILASGMRQSIDKALNQSFAGDLVLRHVDDASTIPDQVGPAVSELDGVAATSPLGNAEARVDGAPGTVEVSGVEPASIGRVLDLEWEHGEEDVLGRLGEAGAAVDADWAEAHGVRVGQQLTLTTRVRSNVTLTVKGSYRNPPGILGTVVVPSSTLAAQFGERRTGMVLVAFARQADAAAARERIDRLLEERYPAVQSRSQTELEQDLGERLDDLVGLVYALLALSVVVALVGIVNTLALAIHERRRELGIMRAVGGSKRQLRRMVRYEALITAWIGALFGIPVGTLFAAAVTRALANEGLELSVPVGTLLVLMVVAALAGALAAVGPARRAARTDILQAIAYE